MTWLLKEHADYRFEGVPETLSPMAIFVARLHRTSEVEGEPLSLMGFPAKPGQLFPIDSTQALLVIDEFIHRWHLYELLEDSKIREELEVQLFRPLPLAPGITGCAIRGQLISRDRVEMLRVAYELVRGNERTRILASDLHAMKKATKNKEHPESDGFSYFSSAYWRILRMNLLANNANCATPGCQNRWNHLHHLSYACIGREYEIAFNPAQSELAQICGKCHSEIHMNEKLNTFSREWHDSEEGLQYLESTPGKFLAVAAAFVGDRWREISKGEGRS